MIGLTVLQTCADYAASENYTDALANGSFMDAVTCPYANQVGGEVLALMVFGAVFIALRIYSDSIVIPLILAIAIGGAFVAQLTSGPVQVAVIVLVLMASTAIFVLYRRLGRD